MATTSLRVSLMCPVSFAHAVALSLAVLVAFSYPAAVIFSWGW